PRPTRVSKLTLRPMTPPLARALPFAIALLAALAGAPRSSAETTEAPDPLVELVARLAEADTLSAADLSRLASLTADAGEQARAASSRFPEGAIRDALAAVSLGRK